MCIITCYNWRMEPHMFKAVYPGTFDPITSGHEDIARRAAGLFPQVILAVAESSGKQPFFSQAERVEMAAAVLADCPGIQVVAFSELLMKFVRAQGARVVLRGLRAASDFEYEFQLAGMNRSLFPEVETLFLTPAEQYMFISASLIREIAVLGGDVSRFVSPLIRERLRAKIAAGVKNS